MMDDWSRNRECLQTVPIAFACGKNTRKLTTPILRLPATFKWRIQQDSTAIAELLKRQDVAGEKRQAARKAAKDHAADHLKAKSAKQGG